MTVVKDVDIWTVFMCTNNVWNLLVWLNGNSNQPQRKGMSMATKEAHNKATQKYNAKTYYRPSIMLNRKYQDKVINRANELNLSVSAYIQSLIKKDLGIEDE